MTRPETPPDTRAPETAEARYRNHPVRAALLAADLLIARAREGNRKP